MTTTEKPLAFELETLDGLSPERASLYEHDEPTKRFRLRLDSDPRRVLSALREERDGRARAEKVAATATTERDEAIAAATRERDAAIAEAEGVRLALLESRIVTAAQLEGVHASALPDAIRAARDDFKLDPKGNVVSKDGSQVDLRQWLISARKTSPHWFPATATGSGAVQSRSGESIRSTVSRSRFEASSPAQKAALLHAGITITDNR